MLEQRAKIALEKVKKVKEDSEAFNIESKE